MLAHEFTRSSYNSCECSKELVSGSFIYLLQLLYVDNILVACNHLIEVHNLKKLLNTEFVMKNLSETNKILGI